MDGSAPRAAPRPDTDRSGRHHYPKHKVMSLMGKGITIIHSDLKRDVERLMPHCKRESKFDGGHSTTELVEHARIRKCDTILYWETRHHRDLTLWAGRYPAGPTVKFHVIDIKPSSHVGFSGNFRRFTRPVLSFSADFDNRKRPEILLCKEALKQCFGVPHLHHKSAPFVDHVLQFTLEGPSDGIRVRVYQITPPQAEGAATTLTEAGPSFMLVPMAILSGCMGGETIWRTTNYTGPTEKASIDEAIAVSAHRSKQASRQGLEFRETDRPVDPIDDVLSAGSYLKAWAGERGGILMY